MPKRLPLVPVLFDLGRFNELGEVLGASQVSELLNLLIIELGRRPARLRELVDSGDLNAARAEAHGLKGTASNLGAVAVARSAAAIEVAQGLGGFRNQLDALDDHARQTVQAISAALDELNSGPARNRDAA